MSSSAFELEAWLRRIGYDGPHTPSLDVLQAVVTAHATAIAYETIDPLLGRPPRLDVTTLQQKMIGNARGGYCFEQNTLFRAGLLALGFSVTSLQARVVRNLPVDAARPALHMVLLVELPEGRYLADVGYGNLAPTTALELRPGAELVTPHEPVRLRPMADELVLEAWLGEAWEHIYRIVPLPRVDAEYEIANWFTATHPDSPFVSNLIVARPGPSRTRLTLFNERLVVRQPDGKTERRLLSGAGEFRDALADVFGIQLPAADIDAVVEAIARKGTRGPTHPSFA